MEAVKSSEQQAQDIVDAIPQSIAVLSPDGQPLYGNRSLLQYIGLTIAEMTAIETTVDMSRATAVDTTETIATTMTMIMALGSTITR